MDHLPQCEKHLRVSLLLLFYAFSFPSISGQMSHVDSLTNMIRTTSSDSIKGKKYVELAEYYYKRDTVLYHAYVDSSKAMTEYSTTTLAQGMYSFLEGKRLKVRKKNKAALLKLEEAREYFEEIEEHGMIGSVAYQEGQVYLAISDYEAANRSFLKSREASEIRADTFDIASALVALGVIQRRLGNNEGAVEYYREALPMFRKFKNKEGTFTCLVNIAIVEQRSKNYEEAIRLNAEAEELVLSQSNIDNNQLSYVYGNLFALHSDQKNYQKAYDYGLKSYNLRKKGASKTEIASANISMGTATINLGRYQQALKYLREAGENADDDPRHQSQINRLFARAYSKLKNFKKAYQYMDDNVSIKDSIFSLDKAKQVDKLNAEFDLERKEGEIAKLQLQEDLNAVSISRQRMALGGTAGALGVLSFLFYRLFGQKKLIEHQNKEKEILLKEIHHRVKNNLQVISSLLGLQSRSIKNEQAKEAIKEGRTRVHSMSLIHQSLYQKDNLMGIEMQEYLPKLSKSLFDTYNIGGERLQLRTDIQNLKLDVETVIPIGLIVNELITNSLKYAFPDERSGEIFVGLKEDQNKLILTVADDGIGLDDTTLVEKEENFGHSLIRAFRNKLDADMLIDNEKGTRIDLSIGKYSLIE